MANQNLNHQGPNHNNKIVCDVTNCIYNDNDRHCSAKQIKVGPQHASSSADTLCVTFKQ